MRGADSFHETVIVSACLLGVKCRYDGSDNLNRGLIERLKNCHLIPLCPEQLGGLPTPREAAQIVEGDGFDVLKNKVSIMSTANKDVTENFITGAYESLKIARITGANKAFLKEKSPSCGVKRIKRNGVEIEGSGVLAALLKEEGLEVFGV
ncbi:MAG: DUF523 domain-containing protein [Deltaproteobacteria bacterium]|nr:DUF523 domain-containing protein [Deltaproteobacteria bacterium]